MDRSLAFAGCLKRISDTRLQEQSARDSLRSTVEADRLKESGTQSSKAFERSANACDQTSNLRFVLFRRVIGETELQFAFRSRQVALLKKGRAQVVTKRRFVRVVLH